MTTAISFYHRLLVLKREKVTVLAVIMFLANIMPVYLSVTVSPVEISEKLVYFQRKLLEKRLSIESRDFLTKIKPNQREGEPHLFLKLKVWTQFKPQQKKLAEV